jgi:hypothetical protein
MPRAAERHRDMKMRQTPGRCGMLRAEDGRREGRVILAPGHSAASMSPQESLTSLSRRRHRLSPAP